MHYMQAQLVYIHYVSKWFMISYLSFIKQADLDLFLSSLQHSQSLCLYMTVSGCSLFLVRQWAFRHVTGWELPWDD